ncbi:MAG: COQ9 family protein [Pararhodobacter sp.]|nr:COQ9 family protein [Pararhodobacter sp.]
MSEDPDLTLGDRLLDAALPHVAFDGWSQAALEAAALECGVDPATAYALYPRGGLDLALAYHRQGDAAMVAALAARDLVAMRMRERVALAVRLRLESADREAVRRGATLLSLPHHAPEAARALWNTADAIWNALGDRSVDGNWYTKRAMLSGVYSSTVLYWLGDSSPGYEATWEFLDRRVEDVMRIEKAKAEVRNSPVLSKLFALPLAVLDGVRKPGVAAPPLPGHWESQAGDN